MARGAGAAEGGARVAGTRTRPRGSPGQHARLWASKRCLSQLVSVSLPAASSNTECPINTLKNGVPTPCTNTHTHTHGGAQVPSFEIKHTHTHTHTHRRGRQAVEMRRRGPNTIRRGEAGVESNHTSRGRPLPAQNHKSRRDRERNDRETGERGERRERGDTTQGSLPRENGQVWEGPGSCGPQTTHHHMIF